MKQKSGIKYKREEPSAPMSMDDFNTFVESLHRDGNYKWEAYVRLSFVTALRCGDVLSLKWGDFLNKDSITFIEQKRRKERNIKFDKTVKDKFIELYKLLGEPSLDHPVMISESIFERTGEVVPMSAQYLNRALKNFKIKYRLDIPMSKIKTHTFRKTFGRYVYESCGRNFESLLILNSIFNHSSIKQTQTYIGLTEEKIENIYETIKF